MISFFLQPQCNPISHGCLPTTTRIVSARRSFFSLPPFPLLVCLAPTSFRSDEFILSPSDRYMQTQRKAQSYKPVDYSGLL